MSVDLSAAIATVKHNPSAIQRLILQHLEDNGISTVDPTNPFVFLLEASTMNSSIAMQQAETLTRRQYPSLAQTDEELYLHMSDVDYLDRFAQPSRTSFTVLMDYEEFLNKAVSTGVGNVRKLTIPKHSEFNVADYRFTLQYPIDLRLMSHGGLQIVYDVSEVSPLYTLESNVVPWSIVNINGVRFIRLDISVTQIQIQPHFDQLNNSTGFNKTFTFTDQFYFARIYVSNNEGNWSEIKSTHTDQVYDPEELTAALQVNGSDLRITIPQIYFTNGLADNDIRIDIYTTRGETNLLLSNYDPASFTVFWRDLDTVETSRFTAPLTNYTGFGVFSDSSVTGGRDSLSFEELRDRVLNNSLGKNNLPITGNQLEATLNNLNYDIKKEIDNITKRTYLATRELPTPDDNGTSAGCGIFLLESTIDNLVNNDTVNLHLERATMLPNTLYELNDGILSVVNDNRVSAIEALSGDARAAEINGHTYLFSPFHYVLDFTNNAFELRPYYLDEPEISSKTFIEENDTAELAISVDSYSISKIEEGYRILIATRSGDGFKELDNGQITAQLSFVPTNETERAYLNGTFIGYVEEERVYEFILGTTFDIDETHSLFLNTFKFFDDSIRQLGTPLTQAFDITFIVTDYVSVNLRNSNIDLIVGGDFIEGNDPIGISREQLTIYFGEALVNLWSNSRTVVGTADYQVYETDVQQFYEETIYARDPVTGNIILEFDDATGEVEFTVLHNIGDPVLDPEGEIVYKHRAGDIIFDLDGNPVVINERKILRQIELFLLDGVYRYATEASSVDYRNSLYKTVVDWVITDIAGINDDLLEQTRLYFYPKTTFGNIDVIIDEGTQRNIPSEQSFDVKLYMTRTNFDSLELRTPLTEQAISTIAEGLKKTTVSLTEIASTLAARLGGDILSVEITGLGGDEEVATATVVDSSNNLTIRKKLVTLSNGELMVVDDVDVEFIRHIEG